METLIKTIVLVEGSEGKRYWIKALKVSDTIKGRLLIHFDLLTKETL